MNILSLKIVRLSDQKPKYSFIKMPNPTNILKIVKTIGSNKIEDYIHDMKIEKEAFSLMKELKYLDLEALETSIYEIKANSLKGLSNLEYLRVGFGKLRNKNIFSKLPNLKHLEFVLDENSKNFSSNAFYGLSKLVELTIHENEHVQDKFDFSFRNLKSLRILRIELESIDEFNYFKDLKNLRELYLGCLHIEKGALIGLVNLEKLKLYNMISNTSLSDILNGLSSLKELTIEYPCIKHMSKESFKGLINLEKLNLIGFKIDILHRDVFNDLKSLKTINMANSTIKAVQPNPFEFVEKLEAIHLNFSILRVLGSKSYLNKIKEITIEVNNIDEAFNFISNSELNNLIKLTIIAFKEGSNILIKNDTLIGLEGLKMMSLSNFNLKLEPNSFNNMINLYRLELSSNNMCFNYEYNDIFCNLTKLTYLDLSNNQKFDVESSFFKGLNNLTYLNLNRMEVTLKDKLFEYVPNLKRLELNHGTIKTISEMAFYGLNKLTHLNLARSQLTTVDKNAFSCLSKLKELDLSENHIEEMNDESFIGLVNLKKLNLYQNPFIYRRGIAEFYHNLNIKDLDLIVF